MSKIAVFNLEGKEVANKEVASFEVKENPVLFAQAVATALANRRNPIANTKTRGEVSGGGKKPFKQKGTGNARAGSTRSPLWIGGGITFGPTNARNFKKRIPSRITNYVLKMVLAEKIAAKKFILLENFNLPKISTKQVYNIFAKLPIQEGKILVILSELNVNAELSLANISYAKVIKAENINVLDISKYDYIVTTIAGLDKLMQSLRLADKKVAK